MTFSKSSLLHVTSWIFCTNSKYFLHTINIHQDVSLGWYKILSDKSSYHNFSCSGRYYSLLMHFHAHHKKRQHLNKEQYLTTSALQGKYI